jgi:prepilin-type N-terminal cleavage/methylation domain-containing protein
MRNEQGFSLIELMVAMLVASLLMGLGYTAFRSYWLNRGFEGAHTQIVTELRHLQELTVSETHPIVYGARFRPSSAYTTDSGRWTVIKYNPTDPVAQCKELGTTEFGGGAFVAQATFDPPPSTMDASLCPGYGSAGNRFVFFFARGTATAGTLTLKNDILEKTSDVGVLGLTSRVEG